MVTLIYILVITGLILLISILDSLVYKIPFVQSFLMIYSFEVGTRKTIVLVTSFLGFLSSLFIDYHLHKQKKKQQASK
ncbi:hypothetical protein [Halalkalibacter lacteus]|uniref:hypothetical protein n=1 Tax=Halalkalibacter lacteus TaxID=3090663 RepID=UPI002FCB72CA